MIKFICSNPDKTLTAHSRKEAIKLIQQGTFSKFRNVIVHISDCERFNLESLRAKEYFGIRRT